jgi:biopolymer transport protein ExbB
MYLFLAALAAQPAAQAGQPADKNKLSFDIVEIVSHMGPAAMVVASVLLVFGLYTAAVFIERLYTFSKVRNTSNAFGPQAGKYLEKADHAGLIKAAQVDPANYLGQMLAAGIKTYDKAEADPSPDVTPIELSRRELLRQADGMNQRLRRGLPTMASVGSTAPFVGLLGTVLGIIEAFGKIGGDNSAGIGTVGAGIAEALVVTAFGLMVAIPAVMIFNFLTTKADQIVLALDQSRGELTDYLEARGGKNKQRLANAA